MMFRLYCGNLDSRVTEETLQDLFEENSLSVTNVVVKRGYAFVDCPDQTTLDKSIDKLNGKSKLSTTYLRSIRIKLFSLKATIRDII